MNVIHIYLYLTAPKTVGRRSRKPGLDRKPRQAYSAKQLERLEAEFKVSTFVFIMIFSRFRIVNTRS